MKRKINILVIEDDSTMREGIETVLNKDGYNIFTAKSGEEGERIFNNEHPDLVISDLKLPGKSGIDLLDEFLNHPQKSEIILISAYGTVDVAVKALKKGAKDFIAKPFSIDELRSKVEHVLSNIEAVENVTTKQDLDVFHGIVGNSQPIKQIIQKIQDVAEVNSPVLITGESGTGKELVARAIHAEGERKDQPFLAVNCGALSESLLESELFGHEEGAFTGAIRQHKGVFERANKGTILLDEIGEISQRMQVKLLRVLQDQTFHRVGGTKEIKTDVRIIASTNRNIREAIEHGGFREDLYFRLNVIPLHIPSLREHTGDIEALVEFIARNKAEKLGKPIPKWSTEAMQKLERYSWPGNIRELENFLERLLVFTNKDIISGVDIYFDDRDSFDVHGTDTLPEVIENTEYNMITRALEKANGVKQHAAKLLGLNTSTLYYKMEKYGISDPEKDPAE